MEATEKLRNLKPYWLLDEGDKDEFKHYLSQFITARCPSCGSHKVFVDGDEHVVQVGDKTRLLAAYYAVCDDCCHVWCRAASPDLVVDQCLAQTAELDLKDVRVPRHVLAESPSNVRAEGKSAEQRVDELVNAGPYHHAITNLSRSGKQET